MKFYYVILLVIISNNILLNLPIALTYYFISIDLFFQYIKLHLSIVINWVFYIALLKSKSAIILL